MESAGETSVWRIQIKNRKPVIGATQHGVVICQGRRLRGRIRDERDLTLWRPCDPASSRQSGTEIRGSAFQRSTSLTSNALKSDDIPPQRVDNSLPGV